MLTLATLAIIGLAFSIYRWQDDAPSRIRETREEYRPPERPRPARPTATRPAADAGFTFRDTRIPAGQHATGRLYDPKGNTRLVFQSVEQEPVSADTWHLTQPSGWVLLPGGQIAHVEADEGHVTLQRANNYNPESGWLRGNVRVIIDRTTPEWREANPELRDPAQRPETVVKMWLDEVHFDLDLSRLDSEGPVRVESPAGMLTGRGLTLVWDEVDRRIRLLRIHEGDRAVVYGAGLVDLGGSEEVDGAADPDEAIEHEDALAMAVPAATPDPRPAPGTPAGGDDDMLTFLPFPGEENPDLPSRDRVDTYRIVFSGDVDARQKEGIRTAARLKADVLTILRDFGRQERAAVEHVPGTSSDRAEAPARKPPENGMPGDRFAAPDRHTAIELRWSGELVIAPIEPEENDEADADELPEDRPNRFHLIAEGAPVEIMDPQRGEGVCLRMEYHDETQQVWLSGSPEMPVVMNAGENRRLVGERQVFLDQRTGLARVEGPGTMLNRRQASSHENELPDCMTEGRERPTGRETGEPADFDDAEIAWASGMEIEFGRQVITIADPRGERQRTQDYVRRAVFEGQVRVAQPGFEVEADHVEAIFREPDEAQEFASGEASLIADRIHATGGVRMIQRADGREDAISCDRLDVEMTVDDTGRNVPHIGRAFGNIVARQDRREIRARDELTVVLASVPRPVTEAERRRLEIGAARCGFEPGSAEWLAMEERLERRRDLIMKTMHAHGDVTAHDPAEGMELAGQRLECTFDDAQQILDALIVGREGEPAFVDLGDFYIRGEQISLDLPGESAEVPGEGVLRFVTSQDLDGRDVAEPIPVTVTWRDRMVMHGPTNTGRFIGQVRAVSQNTILDCETELRIEFQDLPAEPRAAAPEPDSRWIFGPLADALRPEPKVSPGGRVAGQMRKRPAYLHAIGSAAIVSSMYEETNAAAGGAISRTMIRALPEVLRPERQDDIEAGAEAAGPRLLSRIRIAGPRIAIDLVSEYLSVEGAGNLLLEDYRLPPPGRRASGDGTGSMLGQRAAAEMGSIGPNQTLFTWRNAMTYLNARNVAVFDRDVEMRHRAGAEMALSGQLETALRLDRAQLARLRSRRAGMTCENLLVEFERDRGPREAGPSPLAGATRLKSFRATHRVHLEEQNRSLEGQLITFDNDTGLIRVTGSADAPARISELDARTGRARLWRGNLLEWNQKAGTIRVLDSDVVASGR